jgi:hypothetical protein
MPRLLYPDSPPVNLMKQVPDDIRLALCFKLYALCPKPKALAIITIPESCRLYLREVL